MILRRLFILPPRKAASIHHFTPSRQCVKNRSLHDGEERQSNPLRTGRDGFEPQMTRATILNSSDETVQKGCFPSLRTARYKAGSNPCAYTGLLRTLQ
jgi:hypothetical protein